MLLIEALITSLVFNVVFLFAVVVLYGRCRYAERHAARDELTGLLNRRGFRISLETVLGAFSRRKIQRLSIACIDLNDFKPVNDVLGHHAGDEVLKVFAQILSKTTRGTDVVARVGGDEFVVVFPDASEENITKVLERARKHLEEHPYSFANRKEYKDIALTFSYGVASADKNGKAFNVLLHEAERKCEENKNRSGRGR